METDDNSSLHVDRRSASQWQDFCTARQLLRRAFQNWLNTDPDHDDVTAEIDGTTGQLRGIAAVDAMTKERVSC